MRKWQLREINIPYTAYNLLKFLLGTIEILAFIKKTFAFLIITSYKTNPQF